jgi:hypothetical protein
VGAAALALLWGGAGAAHAGFLVNIQFNEQDDRAHSPTYRGAGVLGAAGDVWNVVSGQFDHAPGASNLSLVTADGTASNVTLSYSTPFGFFDGTGQIPPALFQGTRFQNLLDAYLFTFDSVTVSLGGLTPGGTYRLILYSASNVATRDTDFTVGGVTRKVVTPDTALTPGDGYADFTAAADTSGQISIRVAVGANFEGDLNGIQLQAMPAASSVPEPASLTLLGTGALGLFGSCWRMRKQPT